MKYSDIVKNFDDYIENMITAKSDFQKIKYWNDRNDFLSEKVYLARHLGRHYLPDIYKGILLE